MKKYLYETHLHTFPVSKCARKTVRENLEFYKNIGYEGVFITNHFIDGNINIDSSASYEEKINFYFSDYEEALKIGEEIGISVFYGVESSYKGSDFLIYGLDKEFYLTHPEIPDLKRTDLLTLLIDAGALIIQAHPYREASYINHIRLFPRHVHGVEIHNSGTNELANKMAQIYAENYELIPFSGSDNHKGDKATHISGVAFDSPITDISDFIVRVKERKAIPFNTPVSELGEFLEAFQKVEQEI